MGNIYYLNFRKNLLNQNTANKGETTSWPIIIKGKNYPGKTDYVGLI